VELVPFPFVQDFEFFRNLLKRDPDTNQACRLAGAVLYFLGQHPFSSNPISDLTVVVLFRQRTGRIRSAERTEVHLISKLSFTN
jgi:hypothetical protein